MTTAQLSPAPTSKQGSSQSHIHEPEGVEPVPFWLQSVKFVIIVLPFIGLITAMVLLWGRGIGWTEVGLFLGMYILTGFGITVGFHRLFSHRSFETSRIVQGIFGILGSMAVQGSLLTWVAYHRRHHQHSDKEKDPHSPLHSGRGFLGLLRGLWHAHLGWMFRADPVDMARYVKDLRQSAFVRWVSHLFPLWAVIGLLIPTVLGAILGGGWMGALLGLVWGGLVRIFLVHHVTWSINSVCHIWGRQPYPAANDNSKNNFLFGILGLGEGWHNNHHAFPTSARHGLRWWQIDFSYMVIRVMAWCRLVWKVRIPSKQAQKVPTPEAITG